MEGPLNMPSIRLTIAFMVTISTLLPVAPVTAETVEQARRPSFPATDLIASSVHESARRFGIPERWIDAVMHVESAGNVAAVSHAGAIGLMQIMPQTYAALRSKLGLGADPYDARDNIIAGAAYLREMHGRYGDAGFLAAYNAGARRWEDYLAGIRPLPRETVRYMARLAPQLDVGTPISRLKISEAVVARPEAAPIFVRVSSTMMPSGSASVSPPDVQRDVTATSNGEQVYSLSSANFRTHPGKVDEQNVSPASTRFALRPVSQADHSNITSLAASPLFVPRTSYQ